jgi:hypothetical protein
MANPITAAKSRAFPRIGCTSAAGRVPRKGRKNLDVGKLLEKTLIPIQTLCVLTTNTDSMARGWNIREGQISIYYKALCEDGVRRKKQIMQQPKLYYIPEYSDIRGFCTEMNKF